MLDILFFLVVSILFWSFCALSLHSHKSEQILSIISEIIETLNRLISAFTILFKLLLKDLLYEYFSSSIITKKKYLNNKVATTSDVNESDYAVKLENIYGN